MDNAAVRPKVHLEYIDAVKGFSMILILWGHISSLRNPVDIWMSSFKVAIFYIISGFLIAHSGSIFRKSFPQFFRSLLQNLMIPYFLFSICSILIKIGTFYSKGGTMTETMEMLRSYVLDVVFLKGLNSMWFIPTLLIGELLFYGLVRLPKFLKVCFGIIGMYAIQATRLFMDAFRFDGFANEIVVRLPYVVGKGIMAAWFLGCGYVIYLIYKKVPHDRTKLIAGIVFTGINIWLSQLNPGVDINMLKEGTYPILFYVTSIVGSIGVILLIDYGIALFKPLEFWGENSMILLCTNTAFLFRAVLTSGWNRVALIPETVSPSWYFHILIILILMLFLECGVIEFINRYTPFMLGKFGAGKKKAGQDGERP